MINKYTIEYKNNTTKNKFKKFLDKHKNIHNDFSKIISLLQSDFNSVDKGMLKGTKIKSDGIIYKIRVNKDYRMIIELIEIDNIIYLYNIDTRQDIYNDIK